MIVLLTALTILLWRQPSPKAIVPAQSNNTPAAIKNAVSSIASAGSQVDSNPSPKEISSVEAHTNTSAELQRESEQFSPPINFYGRVVDQDTNPLSGVRIKSNVLHWEIPAPGMMPKSRAIIIEKTTDADGRFEIHGVSGSGFGVLLFKDGYEAESEKNSFGGGTSGSYENPVVFKMWSTNIHEPLITGGQKFQPVTDGRPYFINLTEGTVSESSSGDLKVWIQYTNQPVRGQLYDWSCGIEVLNGGLLETNMYFPSMYVAPVDGYESAFHLEQQIKGGQRGSIGDKRFYLKLKNGQEYGRMQIDLIAPFNPAQNIPALIRLSYAINPSGSRILR